MSIPTELPTPKRSNKAIYIVFIILLVVDNIYLYLNNRSTSTTLETVSTEKEKLDSTYQQLSHDYKKTLAEVEELKGRNAFLDSSIRVKEFALDQKRKEYEQVRSSKLSDEDKIAKLNQLIQELAKAKQDLMTEVAEWKTKYEQVSRKLDTVSTNLATTQKQVTGLKEENQNLTSVAKILHISGVSVKGAKDKGKGQEKETNSVRHLDYLRLAFMVEKNTVTRSGSNVICYRISTPQNKLLYNPNKGGGMMTSKEDGSEIRYTGKIEFDYANQRIPISSKWIPDTKLEKGDYQIEFYNDGISIGVTKFTLNNSLF